MFALSDDASIWDTFLAGDDLAYGYIYKQHVQKLFLYGMTLTKDEELVKDCIQDVFIRIYENRTTLGKTTNIRWYLMAALRHTLLNAFRKRNTYHAFLQSMEKDDAVESDTALEGMIGREDELEHAKLMNNLWEALTNRQKELVYYRYVEGLGLDEIAQRLQMDYHSVANTIQRALKKMRKNVSKSD